MELHAASCQFVAVPLARPFSPERGFVVAPGHVVARRAVRAVRAVRGRPRCVPRRAARWRARWPRAGGLARARGASSAPRARSTARAPPADGAPSPRPPRPRRAGSPRRRPRPPPPAAAAVPPRAPALLRRRGVLLGPARARAGDVGVRAPPLLPAPVLLLRLRHLVVGDNVESDRVRRGMEQYVDVLCREIAATPLAPSSRSRRAAKPPTGGAEESERRRRPGGARSRR